MKLFSKNQEKHLSLSQPGDELNSEHFLVQYAIRTKFWGNYGQSLDEVNSSYLFRIFAIFLVLFIYYWWSGNLYDNSIEDTFQQMKNGELTSWNIERVTLPSPQNWIIKFQERISKVILKTFLNISEEYLYLDCHSHNISAVSSQKELSLLLYTDLFRLLSSSWLF